MRLLLVFCAAVIASCASPSSTGQGHRPYNESNVGLGLGLDAAVVDFSGTCQWARPPGELTAYNVRVRTIVEAVVRWDARFDGSDDSNVIGRIASNETVFAYGPVEHSRYDYGEGYAVLVRGHSGRVCRGYVRASTVTPI